MYRLRRGFEFRKGTYSFIFAETKHFISMAKEIERKFLVLNEDFKQTAIRVHHIEQGYLKQNQPTVRIRIKDDEAFITIKGKSTSDGLTRDEWEYPIPRQEAQEMMNLCSTPPLRKERYIVPNSGHIWEVDVFHDKHEGLIIAEVELSDEQEEIELPQWIGREVTGDIRYYNAYLASSDLLQ